MIFPVSQYLKCFFLGDPVSQRRTPNALPVVKTVWAQRLWVKTQCEGFPVFPPAPQLQPKQLHFCRKQAPDLASRRLVAQGFCRGKSVSLPSDLHFFTLFISLSVTEIYFIYLDFAGWKQLRGRKEHVWPATQLFVTETGSFSSQIPAFSASTPFSLLHLPSEKNLSVWGVFPLGKQTFSRGDTQGLPGMLWGDSLPHVTAEWALPVRASPAPAFHPSVPLRRPCRGL